MRVFKNIGFGASKLKADGDKYGDMTGDGRADYVWTLSTGLMTIYPNGGNDFISTGQSYWGPSATMFTPSLHGAGELNRRDLHLGDYDGDGKMDIFWTDPDNSNRISVWVNLYSNGNWNWRQEANPAPAVNCAQKRGLHIDDLAVRFADITGE